MKLKKAIEILNDLLCWQEVGPYPDTKDAIKLGREAIERVVKYRLTDIINPDELLPSETE